MAHDVFICHSAKDKAVAEAVCGGLESAGFRCWIAPRNVLPGSEWAGSIYRAIADSSLMVLVYSESANQSPQVLREVERAVSSGAGILPLRIEDVSPSDSLAYYIGTRHWLNATKPPIENHWTNSRRA